MLITEKQLKEMEFDRFYAIYREPGAGKTYTARNLILPYCKKQGWKVLFLTHRNTLKAQVAYDLVEFIEENSKMITIMNYQAIESLVKKLDVDTIKKYFDYQFIICDEAHYFVSDAWNKQSHLSLAFLRESKAIKLFLTGTPKPLEKLNKMLDVKIFDTPNKSIHNLKELLFFKNMKDFDEHFNSSLEQENKKALLFYGNGHHAWNDVEKKYKNSAFICSKTHELSQYTSDEELNNIVEKTNFNCQILCTTSVLEAGINIEDKNVELVGSIRPYSVHGIVQQFARVRKSKIIGAVVEPHYQAIRSWKEEAEKELELIRHVESSCSISDYMKINRLNFNNEDCPPWITVKIDFDNVFVTISYRINELYVMKLKDTIWQCEFIMKHGYLQLLSQYYEDVKIMDASKQLMNNKMIEYLKSFEGVPMFDEEQKHFINKLMDEFKFRSKDKRKKIGLKRINNLLQERNFEFEIVSKKDGSRKSKTYGKHYWVINLKPKSNNIVYIQPCVNLVSDEKVIQNNNIEDKENEMVVKVNDTRVIDDNEKGTKQKYTSFRDFLRNHEFMKVQEVEEPVVEEVQIKELHIEEDPFTKVPMVFNEKTQKWERYIKSEWVNGEKVEQEIYIVPELPPNAKGGKCKVLEYLMNSVI
ncbi:DEAD/DEAH box helicase family protein [Bacillus anthracis]|uniref:DEAD/DEAH box helicase family protein n=1 Tax=Bacillus anthracis TaxID=1392 RepID=UPI00226DA2BD|nr:DEAD/DEAH box helicase family protein [Bacillus anthracis]MCX9098945.1 DEAD/DEAH box helicase family protein [Bacillus anthracis]